MKLTYVLFFLIIILIIYPVSAYNKYFDNENNTLYIQNGNSIIFTIQQIPNFNIICNDDLTCKEETFNITSFLDNNYVFSADDLKFNYQTFKGAHGISSISYYFLRNQSYNRTIDDYGNVPYNQTIPNIWLYSNVTEKYNSNPWGVSIGNSSSKLKYNFSFEYGGNITHNATAGLDYYQVITPSPSLKVTIFWNQSKIIGKHTELKYKDEFEKINNLNGKIIKSHKSYIIKTIFYKKAETGKTEIKTIPSFINVEEEKLTWWNSSWDYSIHNNIANSSRPYQISFNLSNASGTNNITHVFCNGHCQSDFDDIRFTLDNITSLPYWIENNVTGKVWVNVTANGTVNMYYGNSSAITTSNGNTTFSAWHGLATNTYYDVINFTGLNIKYFTSFYTSGTRDLVYGITNKTYGIGSNYITFDDYSGGGGLWLMARNNGTYTETATGSALSNGIHNLWFITNSSGVYFYKDNIYLGTFNSTHISSNNYNLFTLLGGGTLTQYFSYVSPYSPNASIWSTWTSEIKYVWTPINPFVAVGIAAMGIAGAIALYNMYRRRGKPTMIWVI